MNELPRLTRVMHGVGLPMLLGYRKLPLLVPVVLGVIAFIYVVFGVLLERPFPPDLILEMLS